MSQETQGSGERPRRRLPKTWVEVGQVFTGMFARNLFRGLFKLLVAGFLTPAALGLMRATVSFARILSSLIEFGLNHAVTVFVPAALKQGDRELSRRTLMTIATMVATSVSVVVLLGLLLAEWLSEPILGEPGLTVYVRLAVLGAGARLLWKFFSSHLAAHQQFGRVGLYLTTGPLMMILVGVVLALLGRLGPLEAAAITLLAPAATLLLWLPSFDLGFMRRSYWSGPLAKRVLRFSGWVYLTTISSTLRNNLNPLLLKNPTLSGSVEAGSASAGLYGFGNDIANELQMLSGAVVTVMLPKASRRNSRAELTSYVVKAYRGIALLILLLIPLVFLAEPALRLLGRLSEGYLAYLPAIPIFGILYIGGLFSVAAIPMSTMLYAMRLPEVVTRVEAVNVVVLVVGGILLIPRYGATGAAFMVLAQRVIMFAATLIYGIWRLRSWEGLPDEPAT